VALELVVVPALLALVLVPAEADRPAGEPLAELVQHPVRVHAVLRQHVPDLLGVHLVGKRLRGLLGLVGAHVPRDVVDDRLLVEDPLRPPPGPAPPFIGGIVSTGPSAGSDRYRTVSGVVPCASSRSGSSWPNSWMSRATRPVQPVWCEAPRPAPSSPWKY